MNSKNVADVAVVVGRFQPLHNGHVDLIREGLASAKTLVVVLGSSFQARSPKNPFTWAERQEMIKLALGAEAEKVAFLPVRDYYDDDRWESAVKAGVRKLHPEARSIVLVGHQKDATSYYLERFPGWQFVPTERFGEVDATHLRRILLGDISPEAGLAALVEHMPPAVIEYLRAWVTLPFRAQLVEEWTKIREDRTAWAQSPYEPFFTTADSLITCQDKVLLIRRKYHPGKGLWGLPGGFVEKNERLLQAALREVKEEAGLRLLPTALGPALKEVRVFDHPQRSLRGRTITHVHRISLGDSRLPEIHAGDDAEEAAWVPREKLAGMEPRFFEDHFIILDSFLSITPERQV
jgi:bifunctional NMN adenylyltransferase/nudix hydrolase